jgi:hypothetical protein
MCSAIVFSHVTRGVILGPQNQMFSNFRENSAKSVSVNLRLAAALSVSEMNYSYRLLSY